MNYKVGVITEAYETLIKSKHVDFEYIAGLDKGTGVYMIFDEYNDLIYIGSSINVKKRFQDLRYENMHTLVRKMIKSEKYNSSNLVHDFLTNKCKYKFLKCDTVREAEAVEHLAIYCLEPKINKC
jgi:hypothetical protein